MRNRQFLQSITEEMMPIKSFGCHTVHKLEVSGPKRFKPNRESLLEQGRVVDFLPGHLDSI